MGTNKETASALRVALENQKAIDATCLEISRVKHAIDEQQAKLDEMSAARPPTETYGDRRRQLLVDEALNRITRGERLEREAAFAKEEKSMAEQAAKVDAQIAQCRVTIGGLEDEQAMLLARRGELESARPGLIDALILCEANEIAEQYVADALSLKGRLLRLRALNALLNNRRAAFTWSALTPELVVPAFTLPVFQKLTEGKRHKSELFALSDIDFGAFDEALMTERARVASLGVKL